MDTASHIREGESLDWKRLEEYLREEISFTNGKFSVAQFHGGHANLTYLIRFGDRELVLRRPPFGKLAPGTHSMKREYRVLSKLHAFFKQAPRAFLFCDDQEIIGSDFIVMERRNGVVIRKQLPICFQDISNAHERVTDAMVKMMAGLHNVDVEKHGLSHLGKPEGFLERQLAGWAKREETARTNDESKMRMLGPLLMDNIPFSQRISIIHNDIKLDNCQFQTDDPDTVTSLFDWDMTTLGDPLVDLASSLSFWPDPKLAAIKAIPVMLEGPFPEKEFIIDKYASYSGLDMSNIKWYEAFGYWKGAIIAQQLFKRYHDGETKDERMKYFEKAAEAVASLGIQRLQKNDK